jgi:hypothetical protein
MKTISDMANFMKNYPSLPFSFMGKGDNFANSYPFQSCISTTEKDSFVHILSVRSLLFPTDTRRAQVPVIYSFCRRLYKRKSVFLFIRRIFSLFKPMIML